MPNIILFHDAFCDSEDNWYSYLRHAGEREGYKVIIPRLPRYLNQTLESWLLAIKPLITLFDKDSILVGHGVGAAFLLSILELIEIPVQSAIFVSGYCDRINNPELDDLNKTFVEKDFDWKKIRRSAASFHVIHADNDSTVSISNAYEISEFLKVPPKIIHGGGHFDDKSGYKQFPALMQIIEIEKKK